MHATLVTADGTAEESFSLPLEGVISKKDDRHYLKFDVELPESIPYMMSVCEPDGDHVIKDILDREGDYITQGFCYDVNENSLSLMTWGINTEKQYFIAYWGEDYGKFLVASVDPDVKSEEITAHFDYLAELMDQTSAQ